jgi:hypothetical protein
VYGGPEEGGWWYQAGTPEASVPVTLDEAEHAAVWQAALAEAGLDEDRWWEAEQVIRDALDAALLAKAWPVRDEWEARFTPTGKQYSVLGGEDYAVYIEDHYGAPFPEYAPRYE